MHNDNDFERAWRAFAADDARMTTPPALERQVMMRVAQSREVSPRTISWRRLPVMVSAAAMFVLTCAAVMWSGTAPRPAGEAAVVGSRAIDTEATLDRHRDGVVEERAITTTSGVTRLRAPLAGTSLAVLAELPPAIMSLGDGPVGPTEVLQLVRLRLPRETLQSLGVVLLEPDAGGVIDIDVLVGEDGLARDIRQVRTSVPEQ
jgi:hypothetical protein